MAIKYNSYYLNVSSSMNDKAKEVLKVSGEEIVDEAKKIVPVLTGALKNSISYEIDGETLKVGSDLDYALAIEKGSSRRRATPYIEPAMEKSKGNIKNEAEKIYKRW